MARWCTIEMKLKSMEKWLKPYLDAKDEIVTLMGLGTTKEEEPAISQIIQPSRHVSRLSKI